MPTEVVTASWSLPQATPSRTDIDASAVCAKLLTSVDGRKEALLLSMDKPLVIGRNPAACSYVLHEGTVSAIHCKIYAIQSSQGGIVISCQDLSSNGLLLNGIKIRKTCILLMDGDTIQIASRRFQCIHTARHEEQRLHFLDPTPRSDSPTRTKTVGQYVLTHHCLGSGSFATVHLGLDMTPGSHKQVACKIIKRKKDSKPDKMTKEVRILTGLNHSNINRVFNVYNDETFMYERYIFLQLCTGGDLFSYIVHHKDPEYRLNEGETKYIMYQLLLGLKYLHDKHIAHRDVKPENILLYAPGAYPRIQIADFGLARRKSYQETFNVCGTVSYLPPEGILALENKDLAYVGLPADCWSAGLMLYIMLSGHHPFDYPSENQDGGETQVTDLKSWERQLSISYIKNDRKVRRRIVDDDPEFDGEVWGSLQDARTLCLGLLAFYPDDRWTIQDAFHSGWIQSDLEELSTVYLQRVGVEAEDPSS